MHNYSAAPSGNEAVIAFIIFLAPVLALLFFVPLAVAVAGMAGAMSGLLAGWAIIAVAVAAMMWEA
jgi:hypothetical protein